MENVSVSVFSVALVLNRKYAVAIWYIYVLAFALKAIFSHHFRTPQYLHRSLRWKSIMKSKSNRNRTSILKITTEISTKYLSDAGIHTFKVSIRLWLLSPDKKTRFLFSCFGPSFHQFSVQSCLFETSDTYLCPWIYAFLWNLVIGTTSNINVHGWVTRQ